MPLPHRRVHGFTLLELLVVMAIIGLLASYVAPRYFAQVDKSAAKVARAQIDAFEKALETYRLDTGHYPSNEQGLAALIAQPSAEVQWQGPYLKRTIPPDPWGHPYQYRNVGDVEIVSLGRDGKPGGSGDDADIANR